MAKKAKFMGERITIAPPEVDDKKDMKLTPKYQKEKRDEGLMMSVIGMIKNNDIRGVKQFLYLHGLEKEKNADDIIRADRVIWDTTIMHEAAKYGTAEMLEMLMATGANPCVRNQEKLTPFHLVISHRGKDALRLFKILLSGKSIVKTSLLLDDRGDSLVHYAVAAQNLEMLEYLVKEKNLNISVRNKVGEEPIHLASHLKSAEIFSFLINPGTFKSGKKIEGANVLTLTDNRETIQDFSVDCPLEKKVAAEYKKAEKKLNKKIKKLPTEGRRDKDGILVLPAEEREGDK